MAAKKKSSKSPKAVKKADLKKATGGALAKAKVVGWTNPQSARDIGSLEQNASALAGVRGGAMAKGKVVGWTSPQKADGSVKTQPANDDALSGAVGGVQSAASASSKGKASVDGTQYPRFQGADIAIN